MNPAAKTIVYLCLGIFVLGAVRTSAITTRKQNQRSARAMVVSAPVTAPISYINVSGL